MTDWLSSESEEVKNLLGVFSQDKVGVKKGIETLPEAQRTQGIDYLTWVISPANKKNATCIGSYFGHQVAPLASNTNLATRWGHLH